MLKFLTNKYVKPFAEPQFFLTVFFFPTYLFGHARAQRQVLLWSESWNHWNGGVKFGSDVVTALYYL